MIDRDELRGQLMGTAEVAAYVGRAPRNIASYLSARKAGIPEPIARLKCGPIWLRADVEAWAKARGYVGGDDDAG